LCSATRNRIRELVKAKADQRSFHDPFRYEGDIVLTCYRGTFALMESGTSADLVEMDQAIVPSGSTLGLECTSDGTIQIIWSPAFAPTVKG